MSVRFLVIYASLITIFAVLIAFLTGPLWGLRLDYEKGQHLQLIQISLPTFLSYLASAVAYATVGDVFPEPRGERGRIVRAVALGGIILFWIGLFVSTSIYYFSANGKLISGRLEYSQYTQVITLLLGILAVTTSAVTTFLFSNKKR